VANDPMKQFEIKKILELPQIAGHDISFTNSSLWMVVGVLSVILFFALTAKGKLIPGRSHEVLPLHLLPIFLYSF